MTTKTSFYTAPPGITLPEVFRAIYNNAVKRTDSIPLPKHLSHTNYEPSHYNWNIMQVFLKYCPSDECKQVRGIDIDVDFNSFPNLDVQKYNDKYGEGKAEALISSIPKIAKDRQDRSKI